MRNQRKSAAGGGTALGMSCGCIITIILINLTVGAYCFNYDLNVLFGTQLPWWLAAIGGLFLGEIAIPLTVILWLVTLSGAQLPLFR